MFYVNLDITGGSPPLGTEWACLPLSRSRHSSGRLARISPRP